MANNPRNYPDTMPSPESGRPNCDINCASQHSRQCD
jgi:hypothetical protein